MAGVIITKPDGDTIEFDATLREEHGGTNTITEHAVEVGAPVADHVRPNLDHFSCDVLVTNTPINVPKTNADNVGGGYAPMSIKVKEKGGLPIGIPGVGAAIAGAGLLDQEVIYAPNVLQFTSTFDRPKNVFEALDDLRTSTTLFKISTRFRDYDDMVVEELTAPRAAGDGDAVTFTLKARKLLFAVTAIVNVPATKRGQAKVAKGPQPTAPSAGPETSALRKLGNAIRGN